MKERERRGGRGEEDGMLRCWRSSMKSAGSRLGPSMMIALPSSRHFSISVSTPSRIILHSCWNSSIRASLSSAR